MIGSGPMCTPSRHLIEFGHSACTCGAVSIDTGLGKQHISVTLIKQGDGLGRKLGIL